VATESRFYALDGARAFCLLGGIVLHATTSFFGSFPAQDISPSTTLGVACYVIHIFRMSVFFLLAGYFAHMILQRRGTLAFLRDRSMRILVPMIVGWLIFGTSSIAVLRAFGSHFRDDGGLPLLHFWFLYYLCIFYVLVLALRTVFDNLIDCGGQIRIAIDATLRGVTSTYLGPMVLAAPLFLVVCFKRKWLGWWGILPPEHFTPNLYPMVGYGTAFTK
jgi:glucan biosynthesis protein C